MVFESSRKVRVRLGVAVFLALLSGGAYLYWQDIPETRNSEVGETTIIFDFGKGGTKEFSSEFRQGENLFDFTERKLREENIDFESQEYSGLGNMVTKIGDKKNSAEGGYWQYWINGEYASVGASQYLLKPGDKIEWRFTKLTTF